MNRMLELIKMGKLIERLRLKERSPWKRRTKQRTNMKTAPRKVRAHKRSRWELAKLSRRANRSK